MRNVVVTVNIPDFGEKLEKLEMNMQELVTEFAALNANLEKSRTEILGKIAELELQLNNVNVPPEVVAALEAVKNSAASLDGIVPDPIA